MRFLKLIFTAIFLSVLTLAGFFVAGHFGIIDFYQPFVVLSGSMEPTLQTGSVALVRPKNFGYSVGDIITFRQGSGNTVTHRIVALESRGPDIDYLTQGDANEEPDQTTVTKDQVLGAVSYTVPHLGRVVGFAQTPQGFILLVIVPATIIVYEELRNIKKELLGALAKFKKKKRFQDDDDDSDPDLPGSEFGFKFPKAPNAGSGGGTGTTFAAIVPVIGAILVITSVSAAYFSDTESSNGNILSAGTQWQEPTPTPGPGSVVINEIFWSGSNGDGNDEWVELYNTTGSAIDLTGWVVDNLGGGGPNAPILIPAGTIPANGFFLISHGTKDNSRISVDPDVVTTHTSLSNGGEQLKLLSPDAVVIDTANGTGAWFEGSGSTPKKSMERKNPPGDGTLAENWQTASTQTNMDSIGERDEYGTPKAPNGY